MIKQLIKLANHLDKKGLVKEADYLDAVIRKVAEGEVLHGISLDELKKHLINYPECYKNAEKSLGFIGNSNYPWINIESVKGGVRACLTEKKAGDEFISNTMSEFFPISV